MLCNPSQHLWADLFIVVERKHYIRPTWARKHLVGTGLAFDVPSNSKKRGENTLCFGGRPPAHAAAK